MIKESILKKIKNVDFIELIKGSGITLILKILGTFILYGFTLFLTNNFGATFYGEFALFITSMKVLSILLLFGSDTSILRISSRKKMDLDGISVSTSIINSYFTVIGFTTVILIIYTIFSSSIQSLFSVDSFFIYTIIGTALFFSILKIHTQLFRSVKNMVAYSFLEFIFITLTVFIVVSIYNNIYPGLDFQDLATLYLGVTFFCSIVSLMFWYRSNHADFNALKKATRNINFNKWYSFTKLSSAFLLSTSISLFSFWLTQVVLKIYNGPADVGIYDVISRVCMVITIPLFAMSSIVAPQVSQAYGQNKKESLQGILQNSTLIGLGLGLPVVLLILFFPGYILSYFGQDFIAGKLALRILVIGYLFNLASGPSSLVLQMTKHEEIFRNIVIISATICITVCFILVPIYGVIGAAIAYNSFVCTGSILNVFFVYKKFKILPINFFRKN